MAFYNWRVTGSAVEFPYVVHERTYAVKPFFLWQQPRPMPEYRHEVIRAFQMEELEIYTRQQTFAGFLHETRLKGKELFGFYLGRPAALLLVALPWVLRNRWMGFVALACAILGAGLLLETHTFAHYAAPATGLLFLLLVQSLRHIRLLRWRDFPVGRIVVWAFPLICVYHLWSSFALPIRGFEPSWALRRGQLLAQLSQDGGRHLVIVRYGARHVAHDEWVYNEADIDRARVVWAREMDAVKNRELLQYFGDRRVWLLEVDADDPSLVPYPAFETLASSALRTD